MRQMYIKIKNNIKKLTFKHAMKKTPPRIKKKCYQNLEHLCSILRNEIMTTCEPVVIREPCSVKRGNNTVTKSIDSGQPAQCSQADLSRNFLLLIYFCISYCKSAS